MALIQKGTRPIGRAKGTPNRTTSILQDALIIAAANAGGKKGLIGYLEYCAKKEAPSFLALLGKVIPLQVAAKHTGKVEMIHSSMSQKEAIELYASMLHANADDLKLIEHEPSPPLADKPK